MPLLLPKMNSYFLLCFVLFSQQKRLHMKKALWEQSALDKEYFSDVL